MNVVLQDHELPVFDCGEWTANTRVGMLWKLFPDERLTDPSLYDEAVEVVRETIRTGQPPFGGWS